MQMQEAKNPNKKDRNEKFSTYKPTSWRDNDAIYAEKLRQVVGMETDDPNFAHSKKELLAIQEQGIDIVCHLLHVFGMNETARVYRSLPR